MCISKIIHSDKYDTNIKYFATKVQLKYDDIIKYCFPVHNAKNKKRYNIIITLYYNIIMCHLGILKLQ